MRTIPQNSTQDPWHSSPWTLPHSLLPVTTTSIIIAYILIINLQLPDSFKDFASSQTAGCHAPTAAFTMHCAQELMHEQWKILLDNDFLEAWKHGIVIMCPDGLL